MKTMLGGLIVTQPYEASQTGPLRKKTSPSFGQYAKEPQFGDPLTDEELRVAKCMARERFPATIMQRLKMTKDQVADVAVVIALKLGLDPKKLSHFYGREIDKLPTLLENPPVVGSAPLEVSGMPGLTRYQREQIGQWCSLHSLKTPEVSVPFAEVRVTEKEETAWQRLVQSYRLNREPSERAKLVVIFSARDNHRRAEVAQALSLSRREVDSAISEACQAFRVLDFQRLVREFCS